MAGKNRINEKESIELLEKGYDLNVRIMNYYQFRLTKVDVMDVYDWYHTTGSLVWNKHLNDGRVVFKRLGTITDVEDLAIFINNHIEQNGN